MNRQLPRRAAHLNPVSIEEAPAEQLQIEEAAPENPNAAGLVKGAAFGIGSAAIVAALMYVRRR